MTDTMVCEALRCDRTATETFERTTQLRIEDVPQQFHLCSEHGAAMREGSLWVWADGAVRLGKDAEMTYPKVVMAYDARVTVQAEVEPGTMEWVATVDLTNRYLGTQWADDVKLHLSLPVARALSASLQRLVQQADRGAGGQS